MKIAQKLFTPQKSSYINIKIFAPTYPPKAEGYLLYILYCIIIKKIKTRIKNEKDNFQINNFNDYFNDYFMLK